MARRLLRLRVDEEPGCRGAECESPHACAREGTRQAVTAYAELQITSNYSFLRGGSHIEELCAQAKLLGLSAIGITDRNTLAGIARAHQRAEEVGIRLVIGCRLVLRDELSVLVYPIDRAPMRGSVVCLPSAKGVPGKASAICAGRISLATAKGSSPSFCRTPQTLRLHPLSRG
jgi:hypothetical protein